MNHQEAKKQLNNPNCTHHRKMPNYEGDLTFSDILWMLQQRRIKNLWLIFFSYSIGCYIHINFSFLSNGRKQIWVKKKKQQDMRDNRSERASQSVSLIQCLQLLWWQNNSVQQQHLQSWSYSNPIHMPLSSAQSIIKHIWFLQPKATLI